MTKALLRTIQAEYEHTDATIDSLCAKYNCTTKDLRGYTTWNKNIVAELDTSIKLVYETVYAPQHDIGLEIEDEEDDTPPPSKEVIEAEIIHTAKEIRHNTPPKISELPKVARDGFEGLRLLDTQLQTQALRLLSKIDEMLDSCETTRDVKDLVTSHTAIRDSYFNTKAPMINILNGDVVQGDKNELATFLNGVDDDC